MHFHFISQRAIGPCALHARVATSLFVSEQYDSLESSTWWQ